MNNNDQQMNNRTINQPMNTVEKFTKEQEKLTLAQEELVTATSEKWIDIALNDSSFDEDKCREGIKWLYDFLCDLHPGKYYRDPEVHITESPWAMQVLTNRLKGVKKGEMMKAEPSPWYGTMGSASFAALYSFFQDVQVPLGEQEANFNRIKDMVLSGIYDMVCLKGAVIVSKKHIRIHRAKSPGEGGLAPVLHNLEGPCMEWADGFKRYAINGRILPAWIWEEKDSITAERFINETNEEIRAGMLMVLGGERMVKILGAELIDTDIVTNMNEHSSARGNEEDVRLWKTAKTYPEADNEKLAWVEVICPSTSTHYFLPVHPKYNTAIEAVVSTWPGMTVEKYRIGQHT